MDKRTFLKKAGLLGLAGLSSSPLLSQLSSNAESNLQAGMYVLRMISESGASATPISKH